MNRTGRNLTSGRRERRCLSARKRAGSRAGWSDQPCEADRATSCSRHSSPAGAENLRHLGRCSADPGLVHKTLGQRDPAAAFPLAHGRDDAGERRQANRAIAVSAIGLGPPALPEGALRGCERPSHARSCTAPDSTTNWAATRLRDH